MRSKPAVARTLRKALALLDNGKHWVKGRTTDMDMTGQRSYCALGALSFVDERSVLRDKAILMLRHATYALHERSIPDLNDLPQTQFQDIKEIYELAIEKAEGK